MAGPRRSGAALFSLALGIVLGLLVHVEAATIEAKSVALADVSAAVAVAKDGDTVTVPAGTAIWTAPLIITNNITLQGAGADSTAIVDEVPGTASTGPLRRDRADRLARRAKARGSKAAAAGIRQSFLISIDLARDLPFRMTGFAFRGGTLNTQTTFKGVIRINGNSHSFRIDHCTFDSLHGSNLTVSGFLWGVIDHCLFKTVGGQPIVVGHRTWNGGNFGHGSWADDPHWGSHKFVFIEDNVFETPSGGIDSNEGARFVVRYNQFRNCGLVMHGTEGQGRGAKQLEEYNNTYVFDRPDAAGQIRSGTIITHDNTWTNSAKGHILQNYRHFQESPHWGAADGENRWDKNSPNGARGYWARGTHSGEAGSTTLVDTNPEKTWWDNTGEKKTGPWPNNRWSEAGACYMVRNKTRESSQGSIRTFAVASDANSITTSSLSFRSNRVTFNPGDTYEIWKITQAFDQPGQGKSDLLDGLGDWKTGKNLTRPYADPHQVTEPCFSWNNTNAAGEARNLSSPEPSIKKGRDFFNGTRKPGYTPYVYPHPLVDGSPASPPQAKSGR